MFSQESLERLREKIILSQVICEKGPVGLTPCAWLTDCPFCEKTMRFHFDDVSGRYNCSNCKAKGDAIAFLMTHKEMAFEEAAIFLSKAFDVPLERNKDPRNKGKSLSLWTSIKTKITDEERQLLLKLICESRQENP